MENLAELRGNPDFSRGLSEQFGARRIVQLENATSAPLFQDMRAQLRKSGADTELINTLFNAEGGWHYEDTSGKDLFSSSPLEARAHINSVLGPVFHAVTLFLDDLTDSERGKNKHNREHANDVAWGMQSLLYASGRKSDREQTDAVIAGLLHDIGYLNFPANHPFGSIQLAERVFPQLRQNPVRWRNIRHAIFLHEGDNLQACLQEKGATRPSSIIQALEEEHNPLIPAIILADKIQVKRSRLAPAGPEGINDPHVEVNLYGQTVDLGWIETQDFSGQKRFSVFVWGIGFSQELLEEEVSLYPQYAKARDSASGHKVRPSKRTKEVYKDEGKSYFAQFQERYWEIYPERTIHALLSSFVLNKKQEKARFYMTNEFDHPNPFGRSLARYDLNRKTIDQDVSRLWQTICKDPSKTNPFFERQT